MWGSHSGGKGFGDDPADSSDGDVGDADSSDLDVEYVVGKGRKGYASSAAGKGANGKAAVGKGGHAWGNGGKGVKGSCCICGEALGYGKGGRPAGGTAVGKGGKTKGSKWTGKLRGKGPGWIDVNPADVIECAVS